MPRKSAELRKLVDKHHPRGKIVGNPRRPSTKCEISKLIGSGSYGNVYRGVNTKNNQLVAVKVEYMGDGRTSLRTEFNLYKTLLKSPYKMDKIGFPRMFWYGNDGYQFRYLVLQCLGPSLSEILKNRKKSLTLKSMLIIATECIGLLEILHHLKVIHRDIKPQNLLLGRRAQDCQLYLVDFGLCKRFSGAKDWEDAGILGAKPLVGTIKYAPLAAHLGYQQSAKDDLEALGYVLYYLRMGKLPWKVRDSRKRKPQEMLRIFNEKRNFLKHVEKETDSMKHVILEYMFYVKKLRFNERPDYSKMKLMFYRTMAEYKYKNDGLSDLKIPVD